MALFRHDETMLRPTWREMTPGHRDQRASTFGRLVVCIASIANGGVG
jgi:hypothetical protein